jgi:CxxC motif-containing protein (DUF1111 family)
MKRTLLIAATFVLVVELFSCRKMLPKAPEPEETLAEPLEGLTPEQLFIFSIGDENFAHVFSREEGLGPIFVQGSCENCHAGDGKGNPSNMLTRFGKYQNGSWDPMYSQGGPQLQQRAITGYAPETIPAGVAHANFLPANVTGLGFLEAVDDSTLLGMTDSLDLDGDGISGRVNWVSPSPFFMPKPHHISQNGQYIGRFRRKADAVDLLQQVVKAFKEDIGITSTYDMHDPLNYSVSSSGGDNVADPEAAAKVDQVVFYMRTLKNPPRRNTEDPDVILGENIFIQTGCAKCHVPSLTTGSSEIEPLNNKVFHPYTDLLLHDMGVGLDDRYSEGSAATSEWRTPPLWGFGLQPDSQGGLMFLLHDGRARTVEQAINYHGGEASTASTAFKALSENDKQKLITFLNSL